MADRIISLLRDPERARRMGERGLQIVKQKFSCEAQLERVENLYNRLLAMPPSSLTTKHRGAGREEAQSDG